MATLVAGWQVVAKGRPGDAPDPADAAGGPRRRSAQRSAKGDTDFQGPGIAKGKARAQIKAKALGGVLENRAPRTGRFRQGV